MKSNTVMHGGVEDEIDIMNDSDSEMSPIQSTPLNNSNTNNTNNTNNNNNNNNNSNNNSGGDNSSQSSENNNSVNNSQKISPSLSSTNGTVYKPLLLRKRSSPKLQSKPNRDDPESPIIVDDGTSLTSTTTTTSSTNNNIGNSKSKKKTSTNSSSSKKRKATTNESKAITTTLDEQNVYNQNGNHNNNNNSNGINGNSNGTVTTKGKKKQKGNTNTTTTTTTTAIDSNSTNGGKKQDTESDSNNNVGLRNSGAIKINTIFTKSIQEHFLPKQLLDGKGDSQDNTKSNRVKALKKKQQRVPDKRAVESDEGSDFELVNVTSDDSDTEVQRRLNGGNTITSTTITKSIAPDRDVDMGEGDSEIESESSFSDISDDDSDLYNFDMEDEEEDEGEELLPHVDRSNKSSFNMNNNQNNQQQQQQQQLNNQNNIISNTNHQNNGNQSNHNTNTVTGSGIFLQPLAIQSHSKLHMVQNSPYQPIVASNIIHAPLSVEHNLHAMSIMAPFSPMMAFPLASPMSPGVNLDLAPLSPVCPLSPLSPLSPLMSPVSPSFTRGANEEGIYRSSSGNGPSLSSSSNGIRNPNSIFNTGPPPSSHVIKKEDKNMQNMYSLPGIVSNSSTPLTSSSSSIITTLPTTLPTVSSFTAEDPSGTIISIPKEMTVPSSIPQPYQALQNQHLLQASKLKLTKRFTMGPLVQRHFQLTVWYEEEKLLFREFFCAYGREFPLISVLMCGTKSQTQVKNFYYEVRLTLLASLFRAASEDQVKSRITLPSSINLPSSPNSFGAPSSPSSMISQPLSPSSSSSSAITEDIAMAPLSSPSLIGSASGVPTTIAPPQVIPNNGTLAPLSTPSNLPVASIQPPQVLGKRSSSNDDDSKSKKKSRSSKRTFRFCRITTAVTRTPKNSVKISKNKAQELSALPQTTKYQVGSAGFYFYQHSEHFPSGKWFEVKVLDVGDQSTPKQSTSNTLPIEYRALLATALVCYKVVMFNMNKTKGFWVAEEELKQELEVGQEIWEFSADPALEEEQPRQIMSFGTPSVLSTGGNNVLGSVSQSLYQAQIQSLMPPPTSGADAVAKLVESLLPNTDRTKLMQWLEGRLETITPSSNTKIPILEKGEPGTLAREIYDIPAFSSEYQSCGSVSIVSKQKAFIECISSIFEEREFIAINFTSIFGSCQYIADINNRTHISQLFDNLLQAADQSISQVFGKLNGLQPQQLQNVPVKQQPTTSVKPEKPQSPSKSAVFNNNNNNNNNNQPATPIQSTNSKPIPTQPINTNTNNSTTTNNVNTTQSKPTIPTNQPTTTQTNQTISTPTPPNPPVSKTPSSQVSPVSKPPPSTTTNTTAITGSNPPPPTPLVSKTVSNSNVTSSVQTTNTTVPNSKPNSVNTTTTTTTSTTANSTSANISPTKPQGATSTTTTTTQPQQPATTVNGVVSKPPATVSKPGAIPPKPPTSAPQFQIINGQKIYTCPCCIGKNPPGVKLPANIQRPIVKNPPLQPTTTVAKPGAAPVTTTSTNTTTPAPPTVGIPATTSSTKPVPPPSKVANNTTPTPTQTVNTPPTTPSTTQVKPTLPPTIPTTPIATQPIQTPNTTTTTTTTTGKGKSTQKQAANSVPVTPIAQPVTPQATIPTPQPISVPPPGTSSNFNLLFNPEKSTIPYKLYIGKRELLLECRRLLRLQCSRITELNRQNIENGKVTAEVLKNMRALTNELAMYKFLLLEIATERYTSYKQSIGINF